MEKLGKDIIEHGTSATPDNGIGYSLALLLLLAAVVVCGFVIRYLNGQVKELNDKLQDQADEHLEFVKKIRVAKQRESENS